MPTSYAIFNELGDTSRNCSDGSRVPVEQMKAMVSLLVLLNARSNRCNGLQLLISMMLIERATHKQVNMMQLMIQVHSQKVKSETVL